MEVWNPGQTGFNWHTCDRLAQFIMNFLKNCFISARIGNMLSPSRIIENGVSLGSVLSMYCFQILINDIVNLVPALIKTRLFTDALMTSHHSSNEYPKLRLKYSPTHTFSVSNTKYKKTQQCQQSPIQTSMLAIIDASNNLCKQSSSLHQHPEIENAGNVRVTI